MGLKVGLKVGLKFRAASNMMRLRETGELISVTAHLGTGTGKR